MSAQVLLEELAALGITLRSDGTDLEYEGPEEAVTPELLDRLRRHRAELVGLLTGDHHPGQTVEVDLAARELRAAGWKPKERCGKTIWQSPENGFWYSQGMAIHLQDQERVLL